MSAQVVFYQLSHKFVDEQAVIPENARQVMYYSLAIGHHLGVLDCLTKRMAVPLDAFAGWLRNLPVGPARAKLEGLLQWGEIEINAGHVNDLLQAIEGCMPAADLSEAGFPRADLSNREHPGVGWAAELVQCLKDIRQEPALYLMVRRQP